MASLHLNLPLYDGYMGSASHPAAMLPLCAGTLESYFQI